MEHTFKCENCGSEIVTHCFDVEERYKVIYDPPLPDSLTGKSDSSKITELVKIFSDISADSKSMILCITCYENKQN